MILSAVTCHDVSQAKERRVHHVVLVWIGEEDNEKLTRIMTESLKLAEIPQVDSLHIGRSIESSRAIVDDSFDLGLHFTFASPEEMEAYLNHPAHLEFLETQIKNQVKKIVVYDF